jgi:uncharacterized membrane protein
MTITAYERERPWAVRHTRDARHEGGAPERDALNVGSTERVASTVLGGTLLAVGMGRTGVGRLLLSTLGAGLIYRGLSGRRSVYRRLGAATAHARRRGGERPTEGVELDAPEVQRSITIDRPAAELFARWLEPETQARIMAHFAMLSGDPSGTLHWQVRGPLGRTLRFDTTCVESRSGELLRWRSQAGAALPCEWSMLFRKAPAHYGTELTLQVRFEPPGGLIAGALSKLLGAAPRLIVDRTLRNFKSLVESGEIPSTFHNPSARLAARSDDQAPHALRAAVI